MISHSIYYALRRVEGDVEFYFSLLNEEEKKRAQAFKLENDQHRYIVARGWLREVLGEQLSKSPKTLNFLYQEKGKPYLASPLHFNLSHSRHYILLAFSETLIIGVDVEELNRRVEIFEIAKRFFSLKEQQWLQEQANPSVAFFILWTRKEAVIKANGLGLFKELTEVEVLKNPVFDGESHWQWRDLLAPAQVAMALAYPAEVDIRLHCLYTQNDKA